MIGGSQPSQRSSSLQSLKRIPRGNIRMKNNKSVMNIIIQKMQEHWQVVVLCLVVVVLAYLQLGNMTNNRQHPHHHPPGQETSQILDIGRQEYRFDYIKYPKRIDNITEFNQEIMAQIDNALTDYSLKDVKLMSLITNQLQDIYQRESLRGVSKKVEEYQNLQGILKDKYEDSIQMQSQIEVEVRGYNSCKQDLLSMVEGLRNKVQPAQLNQTLRDYNARLKSIQVSYIDNQRATKDIHDKFRPQIYQLEQLVATNNIKQRNQKDNKKHYTEIQQENLKVQHQMDEYRNKLPQLKELKIQCEMDYKQNEMQINQIQIQKETLEESIYYLELQIEEKKLSINLPKILKEMQVDQKQQFADKCKERLIVLQKMYSHELVNKQQQTQMEDEITKLQTQFQEIMELVSQLKQKAFQQYRRGYKQQIQQKQQELESLIKDKEQLLHQMNEKHSDNQQLMTQLNGLKKQEAEFQIKIDQLVIQKEQNDIRLSQVDQSPDEIQQQDSVLQQQLNDLMEQQKKLLEEQKEKIRLSTEEEERIERKKAQLIIQYREMRMQMMDFTRKLNKKVYECIMKQKYLTSVVTNGKNYIQEVNRFFRNLQDLDKKIRQILDNSNNI